MYQWTCQPPVVWPLPPTADDLTSWRNPTSKPGSSLIPPKLTKHQGFIETSAKRTGSQNPIEMPMRGIGVPHAQIGRSGLGVSGLLPGQIGSPPTDSGNRQLQQMSVIGLTKWPVQTPGIALAS